MSHIVAFALCLLGFVMLALATDRQQRDLVGWRLSPRATRGLRFAGFSALVVAMGILVAMQGWGLGLVMLSGHTSLAAGAIYCALIGYKRHAGSSGRSNAR